MQRKPFDDFDLAKMVKSDPVNQVIDFELADIDFEDEDSEDDFLIERLKLEFPEQDEYESGLTDEDLKDQDAGEKLENRAQRVDLKPVGNVEDPEDPDNLDLFLDWLVMPHAIFISYINKLRATTRLFDQNN